MADAHRRRRHGALFHGVWSLSPGTPVIHCACALARRRRLPQLHAGMAARDPRGRPASAERSRQIGVRSTVLESPVAPGLWRRERAPVLREADYRATLVADPRDPSRDDERASMPCAAARWRRGCLMRSAGPAAAVMARLACPPWPHIWPGGCRRSATVAAKTRPAIRKST